MGDLGNLGDFMKEGSVSDLSWLDVDDKAYRELDKLPKQNLDIQPDLEALWARQDESSTTYLVPNKVPVPPFPGAGTPHTMGDMSQEHGSLRAHAEEIRKIARLALMQSHDPKRMRDALVKRFDLNTLQAHRAVLASVLEERGLLGKLYVSASDFPGCESSKSHVKQFVHRFASSAPYVVAKTACGNCIHASKSPTGGINCAVFHKELVLEVPYSDALASSVESMQRANGAAVQASQGAPKERIRLAMLAPQANRAPAVGVYNGVGLAQIRPPAPLPAPVAGQRLIQASDLVRGKEASSAREAKAQPIVAFLRREMLKGHDAVELAKTLRLAFKVEDLQATRSLWEPLFKEAGLYGAIYSRQDSFDDCHVGADFLAKHNPGVRAMVAGSKCTSCVYNKAARCMMYGKKLVRDASEMYTPETVEAVLMEHKMAGRLQPWDVKMASSWGGTPRDQLKAIHQAASRPTAASAAPRMDFVKGFYGGTPTHTASELTVREIVKTASRFLNEGLYGTDLARALRARFEPRDIQAAEQGLRQVTAEQGLQGIYYIDASIYADYGRGCDEAARLHRARLVPYVKLGSKCGSCVHQARTGFCSKINKTLVVEPPYTDKVAQQQAILSSGDATDTGIAGLINNGASMLAEYQMQNGGMEIELSPEKQASGPTEIEFNNQRALF